MIHHNHNPSDARQEGRSADGRHPEQATRLAVLFENDAWLGDMFAELDRREIPYHAIRMHDAALLLDDPPAYPLVFNRVSPSSYLRGHGPAIPFARTMLDVLRAHGRRVINGGDSFHLETSKIAQQLLFQRIGVATPRTVLFNHHEEIRSASTALRFPAFLKPNCGGSGAFVRRVPDRAALLDLLDRDQDRELFGPDHLLLLQEELISRDGTIVRTEFIDGELVYAMRVRPTNTYNLCPADSCERHVADPDRHEAPRVEFEPYPDIAPDAVAQAREIVRAAHLDVGGVEFLETADDARWFIDINATSVYRDDICESVGVDAMSMLTDFIARELRKEIAKRTVAGGGALAGTVMRDWRP
ncbi:MAG: hypothetical protein GY715_11335 [Planctomycetes bacterium]|nr:hypothetical protein [Planctomycetota bacterium]